MNTKQDHTPPAILIYRWLPPLLMMAIIFILSSISSFPPLYQGWSDVLLKKTAHIIEFGLLYLSWLHAFNINKSHNQNKVLLAILLCILYAISDEIHQSFVPGRHPYMTDILIDITGIPLAALFKKLLIRR